MAKQLGKIYSSWKGIGDYAGTAVNTGIVLATTGLEQLTTLAAYRCPCVTLSQLGNCTTQQSRNHCTPPLVNYGYGLSFIVSPAIALFFFGICSNPRTWKSLTGVCEKTEHLRRSFYQGLWTFVGIAGRAVIAPLTWVAIAMLDGRYYACATTALPYDVASATPSYKNCEVVAKTKSPLPSDQYNINRSKSQFYGWVMVTVGVVVGIVIYSLIQCTQPLTYYHAKYFNFYRQSEEAEFDDEMKKKAQKDAESNVLKFMEKQRPKTDWDKISTVYDFHRDKRNLALYSNLDEWVKKKKKAEKKKGAEEESRPLITTADDKEEREHVDSSSTHELV